MNRVLHLRGTMVDEWIWKTVLSKNRKPKLPVVGGSIEPEIKTHSHAVRKEN